MKIRTSFLPLALLALGCTTKQSAALVLSKVVEPTATVTAATATTPQSTTCKIDASSDERSYSLFNPAENIGQVGVVVINQVVSGSTTNALLRADSTSFLVDKAVIDYEVLDGTTTVGRQSPPASGPAVAGGGTGSLGVIMFPKPSDVAGVAAGAFIRTTFHLEGKLNDGSTVHTSEREYLFRVCKTAGCANNPCL